jgi:hypothetical protein
MVPMNKTCLEIDDLNEKLRRELIKTIEPYGVRAIAELAEMTDSDRTKWLFWNLHENLDAVRLLEPTIVGQIVRTQLTVSDGQSMWTDHTGLEKRVELSCKWQLVLRPSNFEAEQAYPISDGWIDLFVGDKPPPHPVLQPGQKGYLDSDNGLYPNQLFLYGWISEGVWQEMKPQLYNASANCHTDIFLRDNFLFPIKSGLTFLSGPAGAIGITNIEFRTSTQPRLTSWARP